MPARKRKTMRKARGLNKVEKAQVKRLIDAEIEDKGHVDTIENTQLFHNKPFYAQKLLQALTTGVDDGDQSTTGTGIRAIRIGDQLMLKNINIRLWLSNKDDRPNVMYKGVLFWYPSGINANDAFVYKTQTNKMLDRYNDKQIRIVDQFIVKSTNNYAVDANNHEKSYLASLNKSYKSKKITYDGLTGIPKGMDLGFALVCYDAYGTLQTDNIASFAYQTLVTFQDA